MHPGILDCLSPGHSGIWIRESPPVILDYGAGHSGFWIQESLPVIRDSSERLSDTLDARGVGGYVYNYINIYIYTYIYIYTRQDPSISIDGVELDHVLARFRSLRRITSA